MTMKYIVIRAILLACLVPAFLSAQQKIDLWPGYQADQNKEHDNSKPNQGLVDGKPVIRLTVCPGGGYSILAIDLEGTEVCSWLNSIGVTAILLKYRVPKPSLETRYAAPLADAQRALGLVRYNASKWGIDTSHIGIMGFSAGGHLSAAASTNYQKRTYPAIDAADVESCKPNFVMLVYPAYLTVKEEGDKIAAELPVNANTPPTLLIQTEDDPVRVESSVFYYLALKKEKVPAEMHLYTTGGHGYGLRKKGTGILEWPKRAEEWLHTIGMK
jgi:acetyl esterase/lipase